MANERAFELRKKINLKVKAINRLEEERREMDRELMGIETTCTHDWTEPKEIKGKKGQYQKSCRECGKIKHSTGVAIKF